MTSKIKNFKITSPESVVLINLNQVTSMSVSNESTDIYFSDGTRRTAIWKNNEEALDTLKIIQDIMNSDE